MIDYKFIEELEGNVLKAYIPRHRGRIIGQSGVTIGKGLDLGNFGDLDKLNLSYPLKEKLSPYVGLRRELAEQALEDAPLKLTQKETSELNKALIEHHTKAIQKWFELESQKEWKDIHSAIQTVVASVLYQYGNPRRVPKFWTHALGQDVEAMVAELRDFGDDFPTRRNREADYLEKHYA